MIKNDVVESWDEIDALVNEMIDIQQRYIGAKPTCNIGPYTTVVLALDLRLCPELSLMIFKLICNVQEGSLDNFLSRYKNTLLVAIMCDWTC